MNFSTGFILVFCGSILAYLCALTLKFLIHECGGSISWSKAISISVVCPFAYLFITKDDGLRLIVAFFCIWPALILGGLVEDFFEK